MVSSPLGLSRSRWTRTSSNFLSELGRNWQTNCFAPDSSNYYAQLVKVHRVLLAASTNTIPRWSSGSTIRLGLWRFLVGFLARGVAPREPFEINGQIVKPSEIVTNAGWRIYLRDLLNRCNKVIAVY